MPPPSDIAAALGQRPDLAAVRLVYFDEVTSTNDVAVELAESGAVDRTTVLAGAQSSGRGRRGHSWHSPGGVGLYMSILLLGRQSPLVTLMAGVAVAEAVAHRSGVAVELKWPNDVVVPASRTPPGIVGPSRKVAGILAERLPRAVDEGVVMGIGINVGRADYPAELGGRATSLEAEARAPRPVGGSARRRAVGCRAVAASTGRARIDRSARALVCVVSEQPGGECYMGRRRNARRRRDRRHRRRGRAKGRLWGSDRAYRRG